MMSKFLQRLGNFFKQRSGASVNPGPTPKIKDAQQTPNAGVGRSVEEKPSSKTATDNLHTASALFKRDFAQRLQTDVEKTAAPQNKPDLRASQPTTRCEISPKGRTSPEGQTGAASVVRDEFKPRESQAKIEHSEIEKTEQFVEPVTGGIRKSPSGTQVMSNGTLSKEDPSSVVAAPKTEGFMHDKVISVTKTTAVPSATEIKTEAKIAAESQTVSEPIRPSVDVRPAFVKVPETSSGIPSMESQDERLEGGETNSFVSGTGRSLPGDDVAGKSTAEIESKSQRISKTSNVGVDVTRDALEQTANDERLQGERSEDTSKPIDESTEKPGDLEILKTSKSSRSKDKSKQAKETEKEPKKVKNSKTRSVKPKAQGTEEVEATAANQVKGQSPLSGGKSKSEEAVPKKRKKKEPKVVEDATLSTENIEAALKELDIAIQQMEKAASRPKNSKTGKPAGSTKSEVRVAGPIDDTASKTRGSKATKAKANSKK